MIIPFLNNLNLFNFSNLNMLFAGIAEMVSDLFKNQSFQGLDEVQNIKFDIDLDDPKKSIEKYVAISYNVEDSKANPGHRGHMYITNLRIIWQLAEDHSTNLSIGLDSIIKVTNKTVMIAGGKSSKYQLILKAQNTDRIKYEFKFVGYSEKQLRIFEKIQKMFGILAQTRSYRAVNLSVSCFPEFLPLSLENVQSESSQFLFYEDQFKCKCKILLTNVRFVIIKENEKKMNYGIPWVMVKSIEIEDEGQRKILFIKVRGILSSKNLRFLTYKAANLKKLLYQIRSFAQTYNRSPVLGYQFEHIESPQQSLSQTTKNIHKQQINEIQQTKVNLFKRKNAYDSYQNQGQFTQTFFNSEVGLMMQNFPEGTDRSDLWEIVGK